MNMMPEECLVASQSRRFQLDDTTNSNWRAVNRIRRFTWHGVDAVCFPWETRNPLQCHDALGTLRLDHSMQLVMASCSIYTTRLLCLYEHLVLRSVTCSFAAHHSSDVYMSSS